MPKFVSRPARGSFQPHLPCVSSLARGPWLLGALSLAWVSACSSDEDANTDAMGGSAGATARAGSGGGTAQAGSGGTTGAAPEAGDPAANGIAIPQGFLDWKLIGAASRTDNGSIRVVTGNDVAVEAARAGQTNPWPDGSMLADRVWAGGTNEDWEELVAPAAFSTLLLMVKDAAEYAADGGWAYASWSGPTLVPSADPAFDRACVNCHEAGAPDNDDVFTRPGPLPTASQIGAADAALNGLEVPEGFIDWRMIGVGHRTDNGSVRVVVGNDLAVEAAREGEAWPTGAMLADVVWAGGTNPDFEQVVVPATFGTLLLMERDATAYAADGGWRYGNWTGLDLAPAAATDFDRACVTCHTDNAAANAYVFTRPATRP